ncbi:MAG: LLM class flavin-dependent oxidoreductase [Alphaproteobacteria bacterium]|nr:LLM class flavin-dependent oxidoreductase [Alphaproteobacteria bacterium]
MKLGFFTMPIHPMGKDWRQTLREAREAFILADQLGYSEAYTGEHSTDLAENITSCTMFLSSLVGKVKRMTLGTGTVNMPNTHPARVAAELALLDHMLDGKFIMGISPGGLLSDAEIFGNLGKNRNEMFIESINAVLQLWTTEPPYDIQGKYWQISTTQTLMKEIGQGYIPRPFQRPHPTIAVTAVAPYSKGVTEAAARGWEMISANFLMPEWVKTHWPQYVEGCQRIGKTPDPAQWRVAKSILVAATDQQARDYVMHPDSPYRFYFRSLFTKLKKNGRSELFKTRTDQPDDEVTEESVFNRLVLWGSPERVADQILEFKEQVGEFGTLLYAGKDWLDPEVGKKSMRLMAEKVLPRIGG